MVNATPWQLYPRERPGTPCTESWVDHRASLDGCKKSCLHWHSIPGTSSESLYRLLYPALRHIQLPTKMYEEYGETLAT
jgi:hypothetical protein